MLLSTHEAIEINAAMNDTPLWIDLSEQQLENILTRHVWFGLGYTGTVIYGITIANEHKPLFYVASPVAAIEILKNTRAKYPTNFLNCEGGK